MRRCGKEYRSKDNLGRHRKIHAGVRFQCEYCQASFGQKAPLTRHVRRKHGAESAQIKVEAGVKTVPLNIEELQAQHQRKLQQQQQQQQQLQGRTKPDSNKTIQLQEMSPLQAELHQQRTTTATATNALILESNDQIRVGNIGAILQTANGQTLTLMPQQLAQLAEGNLNFGTFSLAPIEIESDDRTTATAVPARFALATTDAETEGGATVMHAIQMDGVTQTALPVATATTVAAALASDRAVMQDAGVPQQQHHQQQINLDMASLTPIQGTDGDKETKFYLIPSGSWTM